VNLTPLGARCHKCSHGAGRAAFGGETSFFDFRSSAGPPLYPPRTRVRRPHLTAEQHARAPGGGGASPRRDVLQQIVAKHIHIKNIRQGSPGELRNHLIDKAASTDAADASFGTAGVTNGGVETKMNSQLLTPVDFSWILDIRYISAGFSYKDGGRPGTSTLGNLASDMAHAVC